MRLDAAGLAFLAREEGCILYPFNDSAGHATIGVGHLLHHGPVTQADRDRWRGFDRADAIRLFKDDVKVYERPVNDGVDVPLSQEQFNAIVSLTFNIGVGGFLSSTVRRRLNARDYAGAAEAILMWRVPPELIGRRYRERALFLSTPADPLAVLDPDERKWVEELDAIRKYVRTHGGHWSKHPKRRERAYALIRVLIKHRKHIWRTAQKAGWDGHNRRERYEILMSRTKGH